ncbi:MAG: trigger factor [Anaerolineales bacterium]|nr:trigger factor [Anaerolineales bacterium]
MKIETKHLEDRQVEMTIEVPADELEKAKRGAARRLSKSTKIPGFRPGKAPYQIIVNKFGEELVLEEALETLGQDMYRMGLEKAELEPYAPGSMDEIVSQEPLTIRYTVPLSPEVNLGDYESIRVSYEEPEVTDEDVEETMEELRQRQALIEPADRPAELSDVVIVDAYAELKDPEEGEQAVILDTDDLSVLVEEDTDFPVPGIVERYVGMKAGDEVEFDYTFPEDHENEDLQGREAHFKLACKEVKSRLVPEWTDNLAQTIGDFESLLDLRVAVRENLTEQKQANARAEYTEEVIEVLLEQAEIAFPPVVLEEELERLMSDVGARLQSQNLTMEDYLKIQGQTVDELREELMPDAVQRVKRGLLLGQLVEDAKIEVEEEEIESQIDKIMESFGGQSSPDLREAFESENSKRRIALDLLTEKALDRLIAIAKGEGVPPEPEEPPRETEEPAHVPEETVEPLEDAAETTKE